MDRLFIPVGELRDSDQGCEMWDGEKWKQVSSLSAQEYNNRIFDMLNCRQHPYKEPDNG